MNAQKDKYYIGVTKCCGHITAAMVDDERTTNAQIGEFVRDVTKSGREFQLIECERGSLKLKRCKCDQ